MAPRRTLDETRALLLETGASMFASAETTVSLDELTIIDVCREAGLKTGGSAYKIWPQQERFREDLFRYLLDSVITDFTLFDDLRHSIESDGTSQPSMDELIRTFGADALDSWLGGIAEFILYLTYFLVGQSNADVAEAVNQSDTAIVESYAALYGAVIAANDREFVPPYDAMMLATMFAALADGFALAQRANPEAVTDNFMRPTGPNGAPQPWTLFASSLQAVAHACTRPRNGVDPA